MTLLEQIAEIDNIRKALCIKVDTLEESLSSLWEEHPDLFPKHPGQMGIREKMKFSGALVKFYEGIEK